MRQASDRDPGSLPKKNGGFKKNVTRHAPIRPEACPPPLPSIPLKRALANAENPAIMPALSERIPNGGRDDERRRAATNGDDRRKS
jgi:hypothetical protein